jgi:hypothetical protein
MLHQNKLGCLLQASFPGLQIKPEPTQAKHLTCTLLVRSEPYLSLLDTKSSQQKNNLVYFASVSMIKTKIVSLTLND